MNKFNVGDRIKDEWGITGTIIGFHKANEMPLIEYDDTISGGHSGNGDEKTGRVGKEKHCYYKYTRFLKLVAPTPKWSLVIRPLKSDPDTTIATLTVDGKAVRHESVKRYGKDAYSVEKAIEAVMKKMNGKPVSEVKRQAVKGEWIKIIDAHASLDVYQSGEIYQAVDYIGDYDCTYINVKNPKHHSASKLGNTPLYQNEYVVLENYTPPVGEVKEVKPVKEVKRHAEDGEYIKIVQAYCNTGYSNGSILRVEHQSPYSGNCTIWSKNSSGKEICVADREYVVLENYRPDLSDCSIGAVGETVCEPVKAEPKPIMINGVELKVGCRVVLKPWKQEHSSGIWENNWQKYYLMSLLVTDIDTANNKFTAPNKYIFEGFSISAIDRIIED